MYVYLVNIPEPVQYVIYAAFDLRCESGTSQIKGYSTCIYANENEEQPRGFAERIFRI